MKRLLTAGLSVVLLGCWDFRKLYDRTLLEGESISFNSTDIPCDQNSEVSTTLIAQVVGFNPVEPVHMETVDQDPQCGRLTFAVSICTGSM